MKKDIEWLREEVLNLYPSHSEVYKHLAAEKVNLLNDFTDLIDELDEPEKIVIPQFVADWYEENLSVGETDKRNKFSGNDVFRIIKDVLETSEGFKAFENYSIDEKVASWAEENEEDFIHLIVNCSYKEGYEVEKEPQWVVKDDTGYLSYLQFSIPNIYERETSLDKNDSYKFNSKSKAGLIAELINGTVEEIIE